MQTDWKFYKGHWFSMFHPSQHIFFASIKGASVVMNCPKKFDLGRSRQVGQMSKDEYANKNPTFLFCDVFTH